MIHAYDQWVPLPTADIFDTQMALATVGQARAMYEKAEEQMKEFRKEYSNFQTPFARDMETYQNMVNSVQNQIDDLYRQGIDPLRSVEGRAALSRSLNAINPADLARMKTNATAGYAYLENMGKLQAANAYSQDAEDFRLRQLGITPFDQFSSANGNMWTQVSPIEFQTLQQATNDWYKNRTAYSLTPDDVRSFKDANGNSVEYDPNYQYTGFAYNRLLDIAKNQTPGWDGSFWAQYYRDLARRQLVLNANGREVNNEEVEDQLQRNIADAQQGYLIAPTKEADRFALIRAEGNQQIRVSRARASVRHTSSDVSTGAPSVFREAAARLLQSQGQGAVQGDYGYYRGQDVGYDVFSDPHYQWIDPIGRNIRAVKSQKGDNFAYYIPGDQLNRIYISDEFNEDGDKITAANDANLIGQPDTYFIPSGQMHAEIDRNGAIRYYITGLLMNGTGENARPIRDSWNRYGNSSSSKSYELEVTERAFNYAKKQSEVNSPSN